MSPPKLKSTAIDAEIAQRPQIGRDRRVVAGDRAAARRCRRAPGSPCPNWRERGRRAPSSLTVRARPRGPARAAARLPASKRFIESSRLRGLVPIGYQASPSRAVRRIAGPLSPPTQIGDALLHRLRLEEDVGEFGVFAAEAAGSRWSTARGSTAIVSSVTAPRSSNGSVPIASNSSLHQPTPMPKVNRPSDSTSIVAMILAVSTGGRCGTTVTEVTRRNFEVLAATKATRGQLLVPVAAGPAGKFAGIAIGVFRLDIARDRDMVADRAVIVADRLAFAGDAGEVARSRERAADRRAKPELHLRLRQVASLAR